MRQRNSPVPQARRRSFGGKARNNPSSQATAFSQGQSTAKASSKISPGLVFGMAASLLVAAMPVAESFLNKTIIAVLALDVSDSGQADGNAVMQVCRAQTKALKPGDQMHDMVFANTTEPTLEGSVSSPTRHFGRCKNYQDQSSRPPTVGNSWGTSPTLMLERVYTQVQIQRQQDSTKPVVITIFLDAAEPGPGLPPVDVPTLSQKVQRLTEMQAQIVVIGPNGKLREDFEQLSLSYPNHLRVCNLASSKACIRTAFDKARRG